MVDASVDELRVCPRLDQEARTGKTAADQRWLLLTHWLAELI